MNRQDIKDIKKTISLLKKTRRAYPRKDPKWLELSAQVKRLEAKLPDTLAQGKDDPKTPLIAKILAFNQANNIYASSRINWYMFSVADLEFHLLKLQGKVKTKAEYHSLKA